MFDTDIVAVDTETTGLNPWTGDRLFGVSLASPYGDTKWIEFAVDPFTREVDYATSEYQKLKEFLEDESIEKVFFNAPYDLRMLEFADINVSGEIQECSLAVRICGVDRLFWKLKPLCKEYFDISDEDEKDLKKYVQTLRGRAKPLGYNLGEDLEQDYWLIQDASRIMLKGLHLLKTYQTASETQQNQLNSVAKHHAKMMRQATKEYACNDVIRTITAWLFFSDELKNRNLWSIYQEECNLLLNVTYEMITKGIQADYEAIKTGNRKARAQQAKARLKLNQTFWNGFNPNSIYDKRRYFIDYKKLSPLTFSKKTLEPSIDQNFLEYYKHKEPGAQAILDFMSNRKAKSTYFDWMLNNYDKDCVLHPDLNQFGTLTGRYSGRFLTIPKRAEPGNIMLDVRKCLVPRNGYYWLLADYSQIEARIYADEFEEQTMLYAFANGQDVYEELNDCILTNTGVDVGRQVAKNIFLGKIYGLGLDHLIEMIMEQSHKDVDSSEALNIIEAFNETFPIVDKSMKQVATKVERDGFIRNRYGQVIFVPYEFAYKGVNYIIQSTAARFMKRAMLRLYDNNLSDMLVLQIHDELIFEVEDNVNKLSLAKKIKKVMEDDEGLFHHVDLTVDFEICIDNWLDKTELEL